jgi:AcrR family transcriptional regulator
MAMRADAQRNYDRLVAVAGEVVAEQGAEASLEEIARRAGVGSATLHRHFRSRQALLEAVFKDRVDVLCAWADELLDEPDSAGALVTWLGAVVAHAVANRGLGAALSMSIDEGLGTSAHLRILAAGGRLLARAERDRLVRSDCTIVDVLQLVNAISSVSEEDPERAERMLGLVVTGVLSR